MRYLGGKSRIAKDLVPVIQSYVDVNNFYWEPFVGGANIIDKIVSNTKIGTDINNYLIELLKHAQTSPQDFPHTILYEEYERVRTHRDEYPVWYVGLVGFCASYGGKFFGGYARHYHGDESGKLCAGTIRKLLEQDFSNIVFSTGSFQSITTMPYGFTIYCDIPYRGTTKYSSGDFPYDEFYEWCFRLSQNNTVLVSEYSMPNGFKCIWEKESSQRLDCGKEDGKSLLVTERLFICGGKR